MVVAARAINTGSMAISVTGMHMNMVKRGTMDMDMRVGMGMKKSIMSTNMTDMDTRSIMSTSTSTVNRRTRSERQDFETIPNEISAGL